MMTRMLLGGAAQFEITPDKSMFLFGYPHVKRYSTGVHDPLYSSALYLTDGMTQIMFITNDVIFISKAIAARARKRIEEKTGTPASNIMIGATHTHSGPITVDYLSNEADSEVPKADSDYIRFLEDQIVAAASGAHQSAAPVRIGLSIADDVGVGTNRRDPAGVADHDVPVLMVKSAQDNSNIACMLVCSMHPTVLHEDSTLVSADFPGMARHYLQERILGNQCQVLHHTGPAGNQSPRHVTKANTFAEAERLGHILGKAVAEAIDRIEYNDYAEITSRQTTIDLPKREFPSAREAQADLDKSIKRLSDLRKTGAASQDIRTAECDWFGAEETLTLAKAWQDGRIESAYEDCLPAEIQIISIGPWNFIGWQGECFTDFALEVKKQCKDTFVVSLANGELQGYIVTKEAAEEGGYEASNALFSYESGNLLVDNTVQLLKK